MRSKPDKRMRILIALAATAPNQFRPFSEPDVRSIREDQLPRVSFDFLQTMWCEGLIDGAGIDDDRGCGNYKRTRVWWITEKGAAQLREWLALNEA